MSKSNESVATIGEPAAAPTTRRAAAAAHGAVKGTAARAARLEADLRARADRAGEKASRSRNAVEAQFEDSVAEVDAFVKGRPYTSAGIAFAAGVLASFLLRRS